MTIEEKEKRFYELFLNKSIKETDMLKHFEEVLKPEAYEQFLDYGIKYMEGDDSVLENISNMLIKTCVESLKC